MPSGERAIGIPENLRVIMRVQVDKAGRDDTARSVQNTLGGLPFQAADLGDLAVLDRDVAHIAGRTRPINIRAAFDDNVVICHLGDSLTNPTCPGFLAYGAMFRLIEAQRN